MVRLAHLQMHPVRARLAGMVQEMFQQERCNSTALPALSDDDVLQFPLLSDASGDKKSKNISRGFFRHQKQSQRGSSPEGFPVLPFGPVGCGGCGVFELADRSKVSLCRPADLR